jgi:hypothetical protein
MRWFRAARIRLQNESHNSKPNGFKSSDGRKLVRSSKRASMPEMLPSKRSEIATATITRVDYPKRQPKPSEERLPKPSKEPVTE